MRYRIRPTKNKCWVVEYKRKLSGWGCLFWDESFIEDDPRFFDKFSDAYEALKNHVKKKQDQLIHESGLTRYYTESDLI